jgi:hypothetical protein
MNALHPSSKVRLFISVAGRFDRLCRKRILHRTYLWVRLLKCWFTWECQRFLWVPSLRLVFVLQLWRLRACELHKNTAFEISLALRVLAICAPMFTVLNVFPRLYCEFRVDSLNADTRSVSPQCQEMESVEADNAPMLNSVESE